MKKKTLSILALLALICIVLTGCDNGGTAEIPEDSPYIGTWVATRAEHKGEEMPVEEVVGDVFVLVLKADGTADVTSDGETQAATWKITNTGVNIRVSGARTDTKYTAKGDDLALTILGVDIFFVKQ